MKNTTKFLGTILTIAILSSGCSTLRGGKTGDEIAQTGPTVVQAKTNPGTIELDRDFQTSQPAEVIADVKDFTSQIEDVKLRFVHAPLEIPMENIGGSTWRAQLSPEQLKLLAVSGQTMRYDANVVARNEDGKVAVSQDPVVVAVKTPDLAQPMG